MSTIFIYIYLNICLQSPPSHPPCVSPLCRPQALHSWGCFGDKAPWFWVINKGPKWFFFSPGECLWAWNSHVFVVAQFPYVKDEMVMTQIPQCHEGRLAEDDFQAACVGNTAWPQLPEVKLWFGKMQLSEWALRECHCWQNIENGQNGKGVPCISAL